MRGLKPHIPVGDYCRKIVASFTDAWIETPADDDAGNITKSHLLQMRGLKLFPF